jgi:hypothetical protein
MSFNKYRYVWIVCAMLLGACTQQPKASKKAELLVKAKTSTAPATPDSVKKVIIREADLKGWVNELNLRLHLYDSIYSNDHYTLKELSKFKLKAAEVDSLAKGTDDDHQVSGYSVAQLFQVNYFLNLLHHVLNHPAIRNYRLDEIINARITSSDDGKVYNITIPEENGGTYQSQLSWVHYRADNGKNYNFEPEDLLESEGTFNRDGFDVIETMQTKAGIKYLMQGQVVGCSTCIGYYIQLIHFDKGEPVIDFSYSLGTRNSYEDDGAISFYASKKLIEVNNKPFPGDMDDCNCKTDAQRSHKSDYGEEPDSALAGNDDDIRRGKSLKCVFRFDGHTFVLDKKRSRLPIQND